MPAKKQVPVMYGRRYPWRTWFSKSSFTLHHGVDYNGRSYTMAQQIRNMAASPKFLCKVSISMAADELSLEVRVLTKPRKL